VPKTLFFGNSKSWQLYKRIMKITINLYPRISVNTILFQGKPISRLKSNLNALYFNGYFIYFSMPYSSEPSFRKGLIRFINHPILRPFNTFRISQCNSICSD